MKDEIQIFKIMLNRLPPPSKTPDEWAEWMLKHKAIYVGDKE